MTGIDRRAVFFLISGILCALLVPVTPDELQWVGVWMAIVFAVLALASFLDDRSRHRSRR